MNRSRQQLLRLVAVGLVAAGAWLYQQYGAGTSVGVSGELAEVIRTRASGAMVEVEGVVSRTLSDDLHGDRHQRFILDAGSGNTLLVAHNIDLAPRVPIDLGDEVTVRGQYEWNDKGGVLHWTHHDPDGSRRDTGWIRHQGRTYE